MVNYKSDDNAGIYTLVFSQIFQARWDSNINENQTTIYAINLFAGLSVFNMFGEVIARSPTLFTQNPNFVKKIRFPLHVMGEMATMSSLVSAVINVGILIIAKIIFIGGISSTIMLIPLVYIPIILQCLGIAWLLATIGVFIRDIGQIISPSISALMF